MVLLCVLCHLRREVREKPQILMSGEQVEEALLELLSPVPTGAQGIVANPSLFVSVLNNTLTIQCRSSKRPSYLELDVSKD